MIHLFGDLTLITRSQGRRVFHKDNFFQELEFYDKEIMSSSPKAKKKKNEFKIKNENQVFYCSCGKGPYSNYRSWQAHRNTALREGAKEEDHQADSEPRQADFL